MNSDMLIKQYCKELRFGMNIYNSYSKINATDHADFRLMRDKFFYTFYMQPLVPRPGTYGHNMLALGKYKGIRLISDYLDNSFYLSQKRYKVRTLISDPEYFEKKKLDFLQYQEIRRQLGLYCPEVAEEPFYNENDYVEYKKLVQQLTDYTR